MNDFITSSEMAALDLNCEYYGLSRLQLMENAGKAVADEIRKRFSKGKVIIFAGTGNNGGDGFVTARFLKNFSVDIVLAGDVKSDIALKNLEILRKAGYPIYKWDEHRTRDADVVIDALLGTGLKGKPKKPYDEIIEEINSISSFKVSVDVPSGLNADTGEYSLAVKADLTVTFHKLKPGILKNPELCGEVVVADIGIPEFFETLAGPGDLRLAFKRYERGHKGMHGKILIVGGSPYVGAPFLAGISALKAGADLVTIAVPESIYAQISSFSPEIIPRKLSGIEITFENVDEIVKLAENHDVVVFGMGTVDKGEIAEEISRHVEKMVVDAGGLTSKIHCKAILTPHSNEFLRTFGIPATPENVKSAAKSGNLTILLKGVRDVITDGERLKYNTSGNAGMTVGGTGDVLAGVAGAFFAVNEDPFYSACASAFVTGYAGDICYGEKGYAFTAIEVAEKIPFAIKELMELK